MSLTKTQNAVAVKFEPLIKTAPWVLRVTEHKKVDGPILVISERYTTASGNLRLREYGRISGSNLRACRGVINYMLGQVLDENGNTLGIPELIDNKIEYRGNIPLNTVIGTKIALLFKLHPQIRNDSRVELLAWRLERFSFEESMYWLGKVSVPVYGKRSVEWAKSGLRLMLAGKTDDQKEIDKLLMQLRK